MKLKNKNIIITGASGGIGNIIARKCDEEGANLFLISRSEKELSNLLFSLANLNNISQYFVLDISDEKAVFKTIRRIKKITSGKIHVLINNAGIQKPIGAFIETSLDDWKLNLNINLIGTVNMTFAVSQVMVNNKYGKIINLSGGGSTNPRVNFSAYSVSKTAIVRFTETIAMELSQCNIDVNAVSPGVINTRMLDEVILAKELAGKEYASALQRKKEVGDNPQHVADLISFLASNKSNGIRGKLISAVWDPWNKSEFQRLLKTDNDIATLRRIDNKYFYNKK